jgi:hypothetical protein
MAVDVHEARELKDIRHAREDTPVLRRLLVGGLASLCLCLLLLSAAPDAGAARLAAPAQLRLVNYYPAQNGWTYMWERWHPEQIDRDFGLIAGLQANAVRVIVQPAAFGFPRPTAEAAARLDTVISLAAAHGLSVELTLFDWWTDYRKVDKSKRWVRALLQRYAGDDRLACVELRNEIDPNDANAVAWARTMLPYLHAVLPGVPTTISVGANDGVKQMWTLKDRLGTSQPDFWSFHYYDKPELAVSAFAAAKAAVAPTPVFIGETGYHPGDSDPPVHKLADREDEQLRYFRTITAATAMLGLPPVAPWILLDFSPTGTPVRMPPPEYTFGLFRIDGTPKPAAEAVRASFASAQADPFFNGGFEQPGPALWRRRGAASFAQDTSVFHSGTASTSIGAIAGRKTFGATLSAIPPVPWVTGGETLSLSAWMRGENGTGTSRISLRYYDSARHQIAQGDSAPFPAGTTDWTQVTLVTVVPANASYVRIILSSDGNSGRVWFDDVTLDRA